MISIEIHTGNAAFDFDDPENGWRNEISKLLRELSERVHERESFPMKIRDSNGNAVGFADHLPVKSKDEIVVTIIAGKLYRWKFFPGEWIPFDPKAGDLMRMRR